MRSRSRCRTADATGSERLRVRRHGQNEQGLAVGRKNWTFVGSDDGAAVNTTFTTLIASCHLHDIEPEAYLREVMCLLPDWPKRRVLELAPCNWEQTRQKPETQQLLAENLWLTFLDIVDRAHETTT